jgi:hypothetical protein
MGAAVLESWGCDGSSNGGGAPLGLTRWQLLESGVVVSMWPGNNGLLRCGQLPRVLGRSRYAGRQVRVRSGFQTVGGERWGGYWEVGFQVCFPSALATWKNKQADKVPSVCPAAGSRACPPPTGSRQTGSNLQMASQVWGSRLHAPESRAFRAKELQQSRCRQKEWTAQDGRPRGCLPMLGDEKEEKETKKRGPEGQSAT